MTPENELNPIEKEFAASWGGMEQFYRGFDSPYWEFLKPIFDLISTMRKQGYDRRFRAGQSLWIFILSRSRQHGLRPDQHCIRIILHSQGGMTVEYCDGLNRNTNLDADHVELTQELEALLQRLLAQPIN